MSTRVAVFIDYQNVYKGARAAFCAHTASHVDGQVNPLTIGGVVKGLKEAQRELVSVRIYRGMPSSDKDPKGYGAARRQVAHWETLPLVKPCTRPLNYRDPTDPKEKGIDVMLAVDFVLMAARGEYDVGVMFTADTDLIPALEAVIAMKGEQACEVACWVPDYGPSRTLRVKGHMLMQHGFKRERYRMVHDPTDYTVGRRR